MFAVGMQVIVDNPDDDMEHLKGEIGTVEKVPDDDCPLTKVRWGNGKYDEMYSREIHPIDLENE